MIGLIPAYGRDYKSKKEALADWEAGKDFRVADISSQYDGRYTSIRDKHEEVQIRYAKLQKVCFWSRD